jgi:NAD(P)-dependent dehydrogenase (short-subunit alcohol dehydrogenase family)
VNVSSVVGSSSRPTAYAATQRAIEVLSDALAAELGDGDVLVSCIQPGMVKSGLHHRWEIAPEGASGTGYPLEPEDFARMVLFILEQAGNSRKVDEGETPDGAEQSAGEPLSDAEEEADDRGALTIEEDADDSSEEGIVQDEI